MTIEILHDIILNIIYGLATALPQAKPEHVAKVMLFFNQNPDFDYYRPKLIIYKHKTFE